MKRSGASEAPRKQVGAVVPSLLISCFLSLINKWECCSLGNQSSIFCGDVRGWSRGSPRELCFCQTCFPTAFSLIFNLLIAPCVCVFFCFFILLMKVIKLDLIFTWRKNVVHCSSKLKFGSVLMIHRFAWQNSSILDDQGPQPVCGRIELFDEHLNIYLQVEGDRFDLFNLLGKCYPDVQSTLCLGKNKKEKKRRNW